MEVKVSVIVPVYNVELYLEECIVSIINQTFSEMEIILVNDGSTDRSLEIIQFYALKDSRIVILDQVNRGVSAARNAGIEKASGEYILFVDSDDTIIPNTVETLYGKALETGADVVMGNVLYCYPNGRQTAPAAFSRDETLNTGLLRTGDAAYTDLMNNNKFPPLTCMYFIRRKVVLDNRLYFQAGIIHEDEIWCVKAILSAPKVLLLDFDYYHYRQRENSIMRSDNCDFRIRSLYEVAKALCRYAEELQKKGISEEAVACIYVRIFWIGQTIGSLAFQNKSLAFFDADFFSEL